MHLNIIISPEALGSFPINSGVRYWENRIKKIFKIPSQLNFYSMKFLFLYHLLNVGGAGRGVEQVINNL